jgi:ATP-dependent protease ClpP protease subunit
MSEDTSYEPQIKYNHHTIYFYDDINESNILILKNIIQKMNYKLAKKALKYNFEPIIHLHISSQGGDCFIGLHSYSFIKNNTIPIYTYIDGFIASSATFLFLGGQKKYIYNTSTMLIHQLSSDFAGKFSDLSDEYTSLNKIMDIIKKIYVENTKIKHKNIQKLLDNEIIFNATQIINYGLADYLI